MRGMTPFLWFDMNADEALAFYLTVFPKLKHLRTDCYGDEFPEKKGKALCIWVELNGTEFALLNAGREQGFTDAISLMVTCDDQEEVDAIWSKLEEEGEPLMCGWIRDKFGVAWQITPRQMIELLAHQDEAVRRKAMQAMMTMQKIEIAGLT